MKKKIDEILNREDLDIKDKIYKLKDLNVEVQCSINTAIDELKKTARYCSHCEDYYLHRAWTFTSKETETWECTNSLTGGYLDDYEYEKKKVLRQMYACPKGHTIVVGEIPI
jgi:hypothetical protein